VADPDFEAALRVTRYIESVEDIQLAFTYFGQPNSAEGLDEFHTEFVARVVSCADGKLQVETGYRLARHRDESMEDDEFQARDGDISDAASEEDEPEVLGVAHYLVTYTYTDDPSSEDLGAFAYHNSILNTWPYWRQHVQTMSAAMGLKRLIVPIYKIPIMPSEKAGEEG
jgi:hypothetical protein